MTHQLPPLPYPHNALEPHIGEATLQFHHDKHHAAYVNNLNATLETQAALQGYDLETLLRRIGEVPEAIRTAIINNAGQVHAHTLYFEVMTPGGATAPQGALAEAIENQFGSFAAFKEQFAKAGATRFGSGWAWLVVKADGQLVLEVLDIIAAKTPRTEDPGDALADAHAVASVKQPTIRRPRHDPCAMTRSLRSLMSQSLRVGLRRW